MLTDDYGFKKFDTKADHYVIGRPTYPLEAIDFLMDELGLSGDMRVADVGAGTGILTRTLQGRFLEVVAIEPNDDMRSALGPVGFRGTAESTGLSDSNVNAIFAAQSFHWFNLEKSRAEFMRILKAPRAVALLWNDREIVEDGAAELDIIMNSLRAGTSQTLEANEPSIITFFGTGKINKKQFVNPSELSLESLHALVLSRSYAPKADDPRYTDLLKKLDNLFVRHSRDGRFSVPYKTQVYWGYL